MANLEELNKWCDEARKMLGNRGRLHRDASESAEMKKLSETVMGLLKDIQGFTDLAAVYKTGLARYERIATGAQQAMGLTGDVNKEARLDELHRATVALEKLAKDLRSETERVKTDLENFRLLRAARDPYLARYKQVKDALELLKVTPKGSAVMAEVALRKVEEKVAQDSVAGYEVGLKDLAPIEKMIEKAMTAAEELRQRELEQWANKPGAQSRLDVARRLHAEMSLLPGIGKTLAQYETLLGKANEHVKANDWSAVLAVLVEIDKLPKLEAAQKESSQEMATVADLPDYLRGKAAADKLRRLLPESGFAPLDKAFRDALTNLLVKVTSKSQKDLVTAADALVAEALEAETRESRLGTLTSQLINLKSDLALEASALDMITAQAQFDNYQGLLLARQQALALNIGENLKSYLEKELPVRSKAHEIWNVVKDDVDALNTELDRLAQSQCTPVQSQGPGARHFVDKSRVAKLEGEHDWTRLVADIETGRERCVQLHAMDADHQALEGRRQAATKTIDDAAKALTPAIDEVSSQLWQAIPDPAKRFDPRPAFTRAVEQVKRTWDTAQGVATTLGDLENGEKQALAALKQVARDAAAAARPEGVQGLLDGRAQQKALSDLEGRWPVVEQALRDLQAKNNELAARLTARLEVVRASASVDAVKALLDLAQLRADIATGSTEQDTELSNARTEFDKLSKAVLAEIKRARKENKKAKGFKEAFDALSLEHDELKLLGGSTNLQALKEATLGMAALQARAIKFAPVANGAGYSIDKVAEALEGAATLFERLQPALKTNSPKVLAALTKRLAELKAAVYASDPEDSMLKIIAFTQSVTEAETGTKIVIKLRGEFTELLTVVSATFKAFVARKFVPAYTQELTARMEVIERDGKLPDKLYEALSSLKVLGMEVDAAMDDLSVATGKEGALLKKQHDTEAAQAEWGRAIKVFEGRLVDEARAAVKSKKGDKALILELERMAKLARQTAKDGDHVKAVEQLALCAERARQIVADPYGPAIGSRNNLPKDNEIYREAATAFQEALRAVSTAAVKQFPKIPQAVRTKLENMLAGASAKIDVHAFEGVILPLAAEGVDDTQRRGYREEALAKVRSVQTLLDSNRQLTALVGNPLTGPDYSIALRRLQSALTRLDANVSRCCS